MYLHLNLKHNFYPNIGQMGSFSVLQEWLWKQINIPMQQYTPRPLNLKPSLYKYHLKMSS